MTQTTVTPENIKELREQLPLDQSAELEIGCKTWPVYAGPERGQMTIWPNGRGAVCWGGNSHWGDWDDARQVLVLDDLDADGRTIEVSVDGVETVL